MEKIGGSVSLDPRRLLKFKFGRGLAKFSAANLSFCLETDVRKHDLTLIILHRLMHDEVSFRCRCSANASAPRRIRATKDWKSRQACCWLMRFVQAQLAWFTIWISSSGLLRTGE